MGILHPLGGLPLVKYRECICLMWWKNELKTQKSCLQPLLGSFLRDRRQICSKCIFLNLLRNSRFKLKTAAVSLCSLRRAQKNKEHHTQTVYTFSAVTETERWHDWSKELTVASGLILVHVSSSAVFWTSPYIEMTFLQALPLPWQPPFALWSGL